MSDFYRDLSLRDRSGLSDQGFTGDRKIIGRPDEFDGSTSREDIDRRRIIMKKLTFSRIGCAVMIGLLAPIGAGYAADANDRIQRNLGGDSPSLTSDHEAGTPARGAQGPIRSDLMDDHAVPSAPYAYAEDAPAYRFAYPEDAPPLSATSSGADGP